MSADPVAMYDIAKLNHNFGVPGRIAFRAGICQEPVAVLAEAHGSCEISFYGAHVLSYRPVGHSPVLWLSPDAASCPAGKAIRGGIPVCWPWFGALDATCPDGSRPPSHGFARTSRWDILKTDYDSSSTSMTLTLKDSERTRAIWPGKFRLELTVTVGAKLMLRLVTFNVGDTPFDVTEALHSYFRVKNIADVSINGLYGCAYLDKARMPTHGKQECSSITFSEETDRIYTNFNGDCVIEDKGLGRVVEIVKEGSNATVVWNPWSEKAATLKDMPDDAYKSFVCVETANAGTKPLTIEPGASHEIATAIMARYPNDTAK